MGVNVVLESGKLSFAKRISAALIAVLLVAFSMAGIATKTYAYDAIKITEEQPSITAESAVVYSDDLGKVVFSKNADKRQNPYSITKLMTAYIVAERLPMDQRVKVKGVSAEPDETQMKLKEGEVLTVRELVEGLLVESGNDAARMLAKAVAGSEKDFAKLMNEQAAKWGCENTHFANASGMQDEAHYTTANDYLIIGRKVLENDELRSICSSKKVTIPATNKSGERIYKNHTTLITEKGSGVVGGKTGFWSDEDCSVVLSYFKKDMSLTVVILGDTKKGREADVAILTKAAHELVPGYVVASPSKMAGRLWIRGGSITHVPVFVKDKAYAYPSDGNESSIKTKMKLNKGIKAPLEAGAEVGSYEVYVDGKLTATHKLVINKALKKGWLLSNVYVSNMAVVLTLLVLALLVALLMVVRQRNLRRRRRHRAGNRKET